jgi:hypothetical protein
LSEHDSDQSNIESLEKICEVVELAMNGAKEGNWAKLENAFHKKARMYGSVHGERFDTPIQVFFKMCEDNPLGKDQTLGEGKSYWFHIVSVTRVRGAAMVMVEEGGCWGSAAFVDLFTVTLNEDKWQVTNKTFAHTGGDIPDNVLNWPIPAELNDPAGQETGQSR